MHDFYPKSSIIEARFDWRVVGAQVHLQHLDFSQDINLNFPVKLKAKLSSILDFKLWLWFPVLSDIELIKCLKIELT